MITDITITAMHPLIGTWITEDDDSNVAITISENNSRLEVSAFCRSDGEYFDIEEVSFEENWIEIKMVMPSTGFRSINKMTLREDGQVDFALTTFEIWQKKDVKPGELPEAWNGQDFSRL